MTGYGSPTEPGPQSFGMPKTWQGSVLPRLLGDVTPSYPKCICRASFHALPEPGPFWKPTVSCGLRTSAATALQIIAEQPGQPPEPPQELIGL